MLLDFDEHLVHRRIMQQAFTRDRLEGMHPAIESGLAEWGSAPTRLGSGQRRDRRNSPSAVLGR